MSLCCLKLLLRVKTKSRWSFLDGYVCTTFVAGDVHSQTCKIADFRGFSGSGFVSHVHSLLAAAILYGICLQTSRTTSSQLTSNLRLSSRVRKPKWWKSNQYWVSGEPQDFYFQRSHSRTGCSFPRLSARQASEWRWLCSFTMYKDVSISSLFGKFKMLIIQEKVEIFYIAGRFLHSVLAFLP